MEINHIRPLRRLDRFVLRLKKAAFGQPFPKLKRVRQITSFHCGPAVLAALFSFVGRRVTQTGIVRSLRAQNKIKSQGVNIKNLARAAAIVGRGEFVFWKKDGAKISDLNAIVNEYRYPVGVEWQGVFYEDEDEDNGHYSIVTAINPKKGYILLSDPYKRFAGLDRKFRIRDFVKRWWDVNGLVYDRKMLFVVTPRKALFPRRLGMVRSL